MSSNFFQNNNAVLGRFSAEGPGWAEAELDIDDPAEDWAASASERVHAFLKGHAVLLGEKNAGVSKWAPLFANSVDLLFVHDVNLLLIYDANFQYLPALWPHSRRVWSGAALNYNTRLLTYDEHEDDYSIFEEPLEFEHPKFIVAPYGQFSPSDELLSLWMQSVQAHSKLGNVSDLKKFNEEEVRQEFVTTLRSVIGDLGQDLRYGGSAGQLTENGAFTLLVQVAIAEAFLIAPILSGRFLELLSAELMNAIAKGWVLRGAWGSLTLDSRRELTLELEAPEYYSEPGFVQARRVE